jgi:hypothetical protein
MQWIIFLVLSDLINRKDTSSLGSKNSTSHMNPSTRILDINLILSSLPDC